MRGWVYVISNKAMPHLVKIGFTLKDPDARARELEQTGVPHPFVVEYEVLVRNPRVLEQCAHRKLEGHRERKEWFRCTVAQAVASIRAVVGQTAIVENLRSAASEVTAHEAADQVDAVHIPSFQPPPAAHQARETPSCIKATHISSHRPISTSLPQQPTSRPLKRIRLTTAYSGQCRYCQSPFVVTLTHYDSGTCCPQCFRYNDLGNFA